MYAVHLPYRTRDADSAWEAAYYDEGFRTTHKTGSGMVDTCSICREDFVYRKGIGYQLTLRNHQFHQLCLKAGMEDN